VSSFIVNLLIIAFILGGSWALYQAGLVLLAGMGVGWVLFWAVVNIRIALNV
jgi:hypothetical protein